MNKYFFTALLSLLLVMPANLLNAQKPDPVDYSDVKIFGAGLSLGYSYGLIGTRSLSIPPLMAYFEIGVHEYFTIGPFGGFSRWNYKQPGWNYSWNFIHGGARASFHYTDILNELLDFELDAREFDLYVTLMTGLEFRRYSSNHSGFSGYYDDDIRFFIGPILGFRYNFSDNMGLFVEGGRGALGALSFGLSFTF